MCEALVNLKQASSADIVAAIKRKMNKFGSVKNMPKETADLVQAGYIELASRIEEK